MYYAGIDVGSVAAKAVIMGGGQIIAAATLPTGWNPRETGRQVYDEALQKAGLVSGDVGKAVGTGYGRVALDFIDRAVTEITCHALGAHWFFPGNGLVIDIGGQDSKAIRLDRQGKVANFVMNDKCAAGTGRFLQVMAVTLGLDLDRLEEFTLGEPVAINSMCTVFAESEVVSLLAAGEPKERIVAGLYRSIAKRVASMAASLGITEGATFTGGVAKNRGMCQILSRELGCRVDVPEDPQLTGALGAALVAASLGK